VLVHSPHMEVVPNKQAENNRWPMDAERAMAASILAGVLMLVLRLKGT
jgi:hypothetical protein